MVLCKGSPSKRIKRGGADVGGKKEREYKKDKKEEERSSRRVGASLSPKRAMETGQRQGGISGRWRWPVLQVYMMS